jgi:parvulin-like peptidyl-prolyl isomerase
LAFQVWIQKESRKIKINDKELKDFYYKNPSFFKTPVEYHARHILVKTLSEAKTLISKLNKSQDLKSTFIEKAKEFSIGPSGKTGGDLGFFTKDKMVPEFSSATSKLKVGSITQNAVKTQFGFHIIYLEDKKDSGVVSFNQAKPKLQQKLSQDKLFNNLKELVNRLKLKSNIIYK